ncbi:hypothetical protein FOZ60_011428 [Perkinsus olseni]|uniref:Uncharacterized protein n=1 Tax=Perkinsus olseni TaxID=32597 RepID=A0A7J6NEG4_PEROL|nr:hypothetical protein FOZ60_011428 [Perkinsus olseni]
MSWPFLWVRPNVLALLVGQRLWLDHKRCTQYGTGTEVDRSYLATSTWPPCHGAAKRLTTTLCAGRTAPWCAVRRFGIHRSQLIDLTPFSLASLMNTLGLHVRKYSGISDESHWMAAELPVFVTHHEHAVDDIGLNNFSHKQLCWLLRDKLLASALTRGIWAGLTVEVLARSYGIFHQRLGKFTKGIKHVDGKDISRACIASVMDLVDGLSRNVGAYHVCCDFLGMASRDDENLRRLSEEERNRLSEILKVWREENA